MNPKSKITLTTLLILFVALTRAMAQFTYNAVDLGTLGGPTSTANAIDPSGRVVGLTPRTVKFPNVPRNFAPDFLQYNRAAMHLDEWSIL
jgi:hypothetical protein